MIELLESQAGVLLRVLAQPGARRNSIRGEHGGALKVSVTAAADKGKANLAIVKLLTDLLVLDPSQLELVSGATSRQKRFLIRGLSSTELLRRIEAALPSSGRQ